MLCKLVRIHPVSFLPQPFSLTIRPLAEKRKAVIEWIYPESFDQKHLEISNKRQKETGTWLLESPEFKGWVTEQQNSRLLWGHGIRKSTA